MTVEVHKAALLNQRSRNILCNNVTHEVLANTEIFSALRIICYQSGRRATSPVQPRLANPSIVPPLAFNVIGSRGTIYDFDLSIP